MHSPPGSAIPLAALCAAVVALTGCARESPGDASTRIAFGSGNNQANAQPLWAGIAAQRPAAWIWAGDAVKPRQPGIEALRVAFDHQRASRDYQALSRHSRMLGIWNLDDSAFFGTPSERAETQQVYLDFLGEPQMSPRRRHAGLYGHYDLGTAPRNVRVILLDCRHLGVRPSPEADLLGPEQWTWLEGALAESRAAFNLIVSPIPVIPMEIAAEKWADYPKSRARLFRLIAGSAASGVAILSGGRLIGELSRWSDKVMPYPVHELTSGGLSHADFRYSHDTNRNRVGEVHVGLNFGLADIRWDPDPQLTLKLLNIRGETVLQAKIRRSAASDPGYRQWFRGERPAAFD